MSDEDETARSKEIEEEIRRSRKIGAKDVLAKMAGPGAMKGASPVSRQQQAEIELGSWIRSHVPDPSGALQSVLDRHIKGSELLLANLDRPLLGLSALCEQVLQSDYLLKEIVREADFEWGQKMDERPFFEIEGRSPDPGDPYTADSVRETLGRVVAEAHRLNTGKPL